MGDIIGAFNPWGNFFPFILVSAMSVFSLIFLVSFLSSLFASTAFGRFISLILLVAVIAGYIYLEVKRFTPIPVNPTLSDWVLLFGPIIIAILIAAYHYVSGPQKQHSEENL